MNCAAVTGQKRIIAQTVILNVRLEQLAVVLDNDLRFPDEPEDTFAQHLAFPVFFLCLAEQGQAIGLVIDPLRKSGYLSLCTIRRV